MTIGYRPKGESGPGYHPGRDYAYITPTLMAAAIASLEADKLPPDAKKWRDDNAITDDELNSAAEALARAQRDFVNAADPVKSFEQALNRRDFMDLRYPVRQLLFSVIGQTFCAAWFTAVREVSRVNEESPAVSNMIDFTTAVNEFIGVSKTADDAAREIEYLKFKNDVLQSRLNTTYARLQEVESALSRLPAAVVAETKKESGWIRGILARIGLFSCAIGLFS